MELAFCSRLLFYSTIAHFFLKNINIPQIMVIQSSERRRDIREKKNTLSITDEKSYCTLTSSGLTNYWTVNRTVKQKLSFSIQISVSAYPSYITGTDVLNSIRIPSGPCIIQVFTALSQVKFAATEFTA